MKCDIIIPVWNERTLTAKCIDSILRNTRALYRILIIDNGSDPETFQYLEARAKDNPGLIRLKRNNENLGFPKAVNQGIMLSDADYVCLLNSDTEVYKGWLEEMLIVAEKSKDIGTVNPASNNLGYKKPLSGSSGEWIEMSTCIGFCMLIKRVLIEKIGNFDEIYSPGNFEDADFCKRAIRAGYRCVMAKAAYVYHTQNVGFKKRVDWQERFDRNRDIFTDRWGKLSRVLYIIRDTASLDDNRLKEEMKAFLKNGDFVWIVLKNGISAGSMSEHLSLKVFRINGFFNIRVLWRVLKRKKRFDEVMTDSRFLAKSLRLFGYLTTEI